jgi:hypothetical protein
MAFFKEAPIKSLTRDRDTAKANVERLAAKLTDAESAVIATKSTAQRAALAGDAAEVAERAALHRHGTLNAAYAEAGKLLALLESKIAEMQDAKTRTATAAATNDLADELIEAAAAFDASTAALADVAVRALVVTMEAQGLAIFTTSSRIEVVAAAKVVATCLREHGRACLNMLVPAAMPKALEPPAKVVPVVKEQLVRIFTTRAVRWRDQDGAERAGGKFADIDVSSAQAKRALASGAALELSNPARRANLGSWPGTVSLGQCFDIDTAEQPDAAAKPQGSAPTIHSAFQVVDRGPAFKLHVAAS